MSELFQQPVFPENAIASASPNTVTEYHPTESDAESWESQVDAKLDAVNARLDALAAGVNQFGGMLQSIVQNVASVGQAIQKGGIKELMGMFTGGGNG